MTTPLIKNSLQKALSYKNYSALIKDLLSQNKSTGENQSEEILNYSMLNNKRMGRLDKTLKLTDENLQTLNSLHQKFTFLVLAEGWCADAAQILPMVHKIADASKNIDLKIVLRDENEILMNQFLTNGNKAIPKVIVLNKENEVVNSWGPRPTTAVNMVAEYKAKNGSIDANFKKELQIWYNKDKGKSVAKELLEMLVEIPSMVS